MGSLWISLNVILLETYVFAENAYENSVGNETAMYCTGFKTLKNKATNDFNDFIAEWVKMFSINRFYHI